MRKLFIVIAALLCFALAGNAQSKAIGARLGLGLEASYEHYVMGSNFIEADLGFSYLTDDDQISFMVTGIYNWVIAKPRWTDRGSWAWYAGPGLTLGMAGQDGGTGNDDKIKAAFGFVAQVGLEYNFWFPLQLSADIRPTFAVIGSDFSNDLFLNGMYPCVSARYSF